MAKVKEFNEIEGRYRIFTSKEMRYLSNYITSQDSLLIYLLHYYFARYTSPQRNENEARGDPEKKGYSG